MKFNQTTGQWEADSTSTSKPYSQIIMPAAPLPASTIPISTTVPISAPLPISAPTSEPTSEETPFDITTSAPTYKPVLPISTIPYSVPTSEDPSAPAASWMDAFTGKPTVLAAKLSAASNKLKTTQVPITAGAAPLPIETKTITQTTPYASTTRTSNQVQTKKEKEILKNQFELENQAIDLQTKQNEFRVEEAKLAEIESAKQAARAAETETAKTDIVNASDAELKSKLATAQEEFKNYKDMKIQDFWANRSTATKVAVAISVGLGAFGSALAGKGGNTAFDILKTTMDEDFQAQKEQILLQRDVVEKSFKNAEDTDKWMKLKLQSLDIKEAAAKYSVATEIENKKRKLGVSEQDIKNDSLINSLKQSSQQRMQGVEQGLRTTAENQVQNQITQVQVDAATGKPIAPLTRPMSAAEIEADKSYGKKGYEADTSDLSNLNSRIDNLKDIKNKIGKLDSGIADRAASALIPNKWLGVAQPKVAEITQLTTSEVLNIGDKMKGSLSDSDREFLKGGVFNPTLTDETNQKNIDRLIGIVEQLKATTQGRLSKFKETGSIQGFDPLQLNKQEEAKAQEEAKKKPWEKY